jgi:hypothetical protein
VKTIATTTLVSSQINNGNKKSNEYRKNNKKIESDSIDPVGLIIYLLGNMFRIFIGITEKILSVNNKLGVTNNQKAITSDSCIFSTCARHIGLFGYTLCGNVKVFCKK